MSLSAIEHWFSGQPEPNQSCFLALRQFILQHDKNLELAWKWKLPSFVYKGKMFGYLWKDKKTNRPYVGIAGGKHIKHPKLVSGNRTLIKIFSVNPTEDIDVKSLREILDLAIEMHGKQNPMSLK